jgi:hypothetical protein
LAIVSPKRFLSFQERVTKPRGLPAASDDGSILIVSRAFRTSFFLVLLAAIAGALGGLTLLSLFGPASSRSVAALQIIGTSILLMATIYVRDPGIETWDGEMLIEHVNRWLYCGGYFVGTAAIVASLIW